MSLSRAVINNDTNNDIINERSGFKAWLNKGIIKLEDVYKDNTDVIQRVKSKVGYSSETLL